MNKLLLFSSLLFGHFVLSQGPTFTGANHIGGTSNDYVYGLEYNSFGEFYTVGRFSGTADFNLPNVGSVVYSSAGGNDIFISKRDPMGNEAMTLAFGGSGNDYATSCAITSTNDLVVVGRFQGTINFSPGPGSTTLTAAGGDDVFILKLNNSGQVEWARSVGGTNEDIATDVAIDNLGNIIVAGYFQGGGDYDPGPGTHTLLTNGTRDIFALKLNSSGNFVWAKSAGSSTFDYCSSVSTDSGNNVILAGRFANTVDFDPGSGVFNETAVGVNDIFVLKLNSAGDFSWVKTAGSSSINYANDITVDGNDNIISTGYFAGTVDFDSGSGTDIITSAGADDAFVWKMTAAGNHIWVKSFSGTNSVQGNRLEANSLDEIYVTGKFSGIVDVDPSGNSLNFFSNGGTDVFLSHLNSSGDMLSGQFFGTVNADDSRSIAIEPGASSENLVIGGNFSGTGDFDATSGTHNLSSLGNNDGFFVVMNNCIPTSISPDLVSLSDLTSECEFNPSSYPSATNSCGEIYYGEPDVVFPVTGQGTTVVTWTYDDKRGNTTTQTQNIIISDVTSPSPDAVSLADVTSVCQVDSINPPTASDNCLYSTISVAHDQTFPITAQGTTIVTWTFDDGHGNTSTQQQNVIITDNVDPIPDQSSLSDVTEVCESSPVPPTATDNCLGSITGVPDVTLPITTIGTTTVTWTFTDANGNSAQQTQDITILAVDTTVTPSGFALSANQSNANYQWINCNTNQALQGETSQTLNASDNGTYAVVISIGNCSDTSSCYVIDGLSIEQSAKIESKFYPNPANSQIVFYSVEASDLSIKDMSGRTVFEMSSIPSLTQIDIHGFATGIYQISWTEKGRRFTELLIKSEN